ncbi:MAG: DUF2726 domain-containing protein [Anaerosomatales bacterium]|nr:DUF2726 domain-containing protein [Coriobacteriia bacterium]MDI6692304.1 DUF2726 domain-containing protein [Anaerosomatales bacterium]
MGTDANENPGCLGLVLRLFGIGAEVPPSDKSLPYRRRDDFLSPAELSFYRALSAAVGAQVHICPKVNLADIFFVVKPNENKGARGRIAQKHVDFLLCDSQSMKPLAGIELDDSSHARAARQERDAFVDGVFAAAALPLVRIPAAASYSPADLAQKLAAHLPGTTSAVSSATGAPAAEAAVPAGSDPMCPKCGVPMVLRTAGKGEQAGRQFYGCPNYPKCRETRPVG